MSTWNTTSTNSHFGSTGVGLGIEGSYSTDSYSRLSPSTPSRTNPWSNVLLWAWSPTTTCSGYLSEVNTHLQRNCPAPCPTRPYSTSTITIEWSVTPASRSTCEYRHDDT